MILVGIFAYQLGGRALWLVPLTFVSVMAVGGFLGIFAVPIPFVEIGITFSAIVLGAIVAFDINTPVAVAIGVVGLFAIFHGHAHGSEMPMDASALEYGIGFMLATALLHTIGIVIGVLSGLSNKRSATIYIASLAAWPQSRDLHFSRAIYDFVRQLIRVGLQNLISGPNLTPGSVSSVQTFHSTNSDLHAFLATTPPKSRAHKAMLSTKIALSLLGCSAGCLECLIFCHGCRSRRVRRNKALNGTQTRSSFSTRTPS